jgi:hypothetical protein
MSRHFVLLRIVSLIALSLSLTAFYSPNKVQAAAISTYKITFTLGARNGYFRWHDIYGELWGVFPSGSNIWANVWDAHERGWLGFYPRSCPVTWGSFGHSEGIIDFERRGRPEATITGIRLTCSTVDPVANTDTATFTITGTTAAPYIAVETTDDVNRSHFINVFPADSATDSALGSSDIIFTDGRLNDRVADSYQSVAVYCENGGITAYALYQSKGYLAFKISKEALAKYPAQPARNTLIIQKLGVQLYKLTSGEYQINRTTTDGKLYSFRWKTC